MSAPSATVDLDVFACPLDGRRLIEASAGTGKTWHICALYLRLLLEKGLAVQQILVVSFTNAATAELRERIRRRLVDVLAYLRRDPDGEAAADPFVVRLVDSVGRHAALAPRDMAMRLDAALQTFDEAAVFTIHGFCQRALADTPFAASLPFELELLQDDQPLRLDAVKDFWRRRVVGEQLSAELADTLLACGDTPAAWARLLARQMAKPYSRTLWPGDIDSPPGTAEADLLDAYARARRLWADGVAPTATLRAGIASLHGSYFKDEGVEFAAARWQTWLSGEEAFAAPDAETDKTLRLFSRAFIAEKTKKNQRPPSHPFFAAAEDLLAALARAGQARQLARLRLLRRLFDEAAAALRQQKRRQRVLSFDDMLSNVDSALRNGQAPWLAESLRKRYPVALIDEFQDTDPQQYAIFQAIYATAGEPPYHGLFLVGDPKQAIYSFRNADLHTYLAARRESGTVYTLRRNQRASAALIAACNAMFAANPDGFILPGLRYEPALAGDKPQAPLQDSSDPDPSALRVWRLPSADGEYLPRATARQMVLRATAGEVARLMHAAQEGRIMIGARALTPADIAILVKSHAQGRQIRDALQQFGIACVELSQNSIFRSSDAADLERVLLAILEPGRQSLLYAALAGEAMGGDAQAIAALAADETRLLQTLSRFGAYRETWLRRGFGVMFRNWLSQEEVAMRLLARDDGERRLTNLLHLGELLQQADAERPAPEALLRWLAAKRRDEDADEVAQLRLESDRNLVQIVTIHKAKGLEYGIVFCPFLWDDQPTLAGEREGREYHDSDGQAVIDFRRQLDADEAAEIQRRRHAEKAAEIMRLIYVALTRAVYRCYLVSGSYTTQAFGKATTSVSKRSLLNWLVAGRDIGYARWREHDRPAAEIDAAWHTLADAASPYLSLRALPTAAPPPNPAALTPDLLQALPAPGRIDDGWRIGSFSSLQHGAESEIAASDHDGHAVRQVPVIDGQAAAGLAVPAADDILLFPRGAAAGDCLHALFERIDFTDARHWPAAIDYALSHHRQSLPGLSPGESGKRLTSMLRGLLENVLTTILPHDIVLATIPRRQCLVELGFNLPTQSCTAQTLNGWLLTQAYAVPKLAFPPLTGYLKGFIDLVVCHRERYYIIDWKSNYLGDRPADYAPAGLTTAMYEHGYHLQYLLYCVALQRYLRRRLTDYAYERHFGGVLYLFVRGVRPAWLTADTTGAPAACGVFSHRPTRRTIDSLDALLAGDRP